MKPYHKKLAAALAIGAALSVGLVAPALAAPAEPVHDVSWPRREVAGRETQIVERKEGEHVIVFDPPWLACAKWNSPTYYDDGSRHDIEQVYEGDVVTVLKEDTAKGRYLVTYNIGDPDRVKNPSKTKTRWVAKDVFGEYRCWTATAKKTYPACQFIDGRYQRVGDEEVWAGDEIVVLDEDGEMLRIRYWANSSKMYKDRWVERACLG